MGRNNFFIVLDKRAVKRVLLHYNTNGTESNELTQRFIELIENYALIEYTQNNIDVDIIVGKKMLKDIESVIPEEDSLRLLINPLRIVTTSEPSDLDEEVCEIVSNWDEHGELIILTDDKEYWVDKFVEKEIPPEKRPNIITEEIELVAKFIGLNIFR